MKKLLLTIFILLAFAGQGWGANWFAGAGDTDFNAVSGGTTSSVWNSNADGTSGSYLDWSTQPANGDVFIANGATIAIDDNIGSESVTVTLTTEGTDYGGTDGGGFTVDISAVGALVLYTNITSGSTTCLSISGVGSSGTELTINGNVLAGTSASAFGIADSHTGAGAEVKINGNVTAGSAGTTRGIDASGVTGTITITGNVTGGSSTGSGVHLRGAGSVVTVNGDCVGGSSVDSVGCYSTGAVFTCTGNIVGTETNSGTTGKVRWSPSTSKKYIKYDAGGTVIYASAGLGSDSDGTQITAANTAAEVLTSAYFVNKDDGVHTQGTASAGTGGGAWGF